jgi:ATP synthase F1 gamma subunit
LVIICDLVFVVWNLIQDGKKEFFRMPTIAAIKKDRQFYKSFSSLIEVLKAISASQFHALEKKIKTFPELSKILEGFLSWADVPLMEHPLVNPSGLPVGVVCITSDAGLLGGVNRQIMMMALDQAQNNRSQLIIVGAQGQKFVQGSQVSCKMFPGIIEEMIYAQALELGEYVFKEVMAQRLGAVKALYPYASSMSSQHIVGADLLPCTEWSKHPPGTAPKNSEGGEMAEEAAYSMAILWESSPSDIIEYVVSLWLSQKFYEILQWSRLAEHAARVIHLEDSTEKVKEIEKKLRLKYFRMHHEIIDQQMRELFAARLLYAE